MGFRVRELGLGLELGVRVFYRVSEFRVQGSGFKVQELGFRARYGFAVQGSLWVCGSGWRMSGSRFRVSGVRVHGLRFRV